MQEPVKLPPLKISISVAKERDLTELKNEMDEFYGKLTKTNEPKKNIVLIARENVSGKKKIVGFTQFRIIKDNGEKIGESFILTTRKGFKGRHIGIRLLGKRNAYFIAKGIKRAELVDMSDGFLLAKTNYRKRMSDMDDFESSLATLEVKLKRKAAREKVIKRISQKQQTLAPQNIMNKDRLLKARMRLK